MQEFVRFGLTDAGVIYLTRGKYLVPTISDWQYLQSTGVDTINFNHIRFAYW